MAIRTWRIIAVPQVGGMTKSFGPVYTQPDNLNEIETSEIFNHTGYPGAAAVGGGDAREYLRPSRGTTTADRAQAIATLSRTHLG
jgi:hypothetical protein